MVKGMVNSFGESTGMGQKPDVVAEPYGRLYLLKLLLEG